MFTIIAIGPNDVEVPCLFYETFADAEKFLIQKGCVEYKGLYLVPADKIDDSDFFVPDFFTYYYGGCGEVFHFVIKQIVIGKSLVKFDLD